MTEYTIMCWKELVDRGGVGGPHRMDRLRRSLRDSFRRRKEHVPESSKPHVWQSDEAAVRAGTCSFHVKYLGCVEVFESRGMQVCEEALKVLRNSRRRPVKAILYVSGDGLRVVEDETKGLIVDQTIEKVSFCAPDRNHDKGFSYICRDGTTRRWMCHGFLALKESKRDKECGVTMSFDPKNSTFTRTGSFRQASITERLQDPQECKPSAESDLETFIQGWNEVEGGGAQTQNTSKEPPPVKQVHNPFAIERPHATPSMLQRQGSFRGFQSLSQASPFKRQLSLRISDLPSNLERHRSLSLEGSSDLRAPPRPQAAGVCLPPAAAALAIVAANASPQPPPRTQRNRLHSLPNAINMSPIPEASPVSDRGGTDPVSAMCQQLAQGLSLLSSADDPFPPHPQERPLAGQTTSLNAQLFSATSTVSEPAAPAPNTMQVVDPIKFHNPWMKDLPARPAIGSTANHIGPKTTTTTLSWGSVSTSTTTVPPVSTAAVPVAPVVPVEPAIPEVPGELAISLLETSADALPKPDQWLGSLTASPLPSSNGIAGNSTPRRAPHLAHLRSHSMSSAETFTGPSRPAGWNRNDPFDAEWAALAAARTQQNASTNPFAQGAIKAFEVQM
ncbi:hypothetical protein B566_EDAN014163 [Ephemera danica]|nr:hypothetical protein B566_EDAN014163 [Ephemera danica]